MGLIKFGVKTATLPVRTILKTGMWLVTDNSKSKSKEQIANAKFSEKLAKKESQAKIKAIKAHERQKWKNRG